MVKPNGTPTPGIRRPLPEPATGSHNVRLPAGADSKLFGGWGVRF